MRVEPRCRFVSPEGETLFEFLMGGSVRIGRAPTNDIVFDDPSVSRHHARVLWKIGASCPVINNSGSANGVRLDGARVFDSAPLRDGARLDLGRVKVQILLLDPPGESQDLGAQVPVANPDQPPAAVLSGLVTNERPLRLVLAWLEKRQATGTVRVTAAEGRLDFSLRLGQVIRLESPWGEDFGAFQRALQLSQGSYGLLPYLAEYEGSAPPLNLWISDLLDGNQGDETERIAAEDL
jgi:pSer/pThr/pTyr-binding forkhead associated (FHA) protein